MYDNSLGSIFLLFLAYHSDEYKRKASVVITFLYVSNFSLQSENYKPLKLWTTALFNPIFISFTSIICLLIPHKWSIICPYVNKLSYLEICPGIVHKSSIKFSNEILHSYFKYFIPSVLEFGIEISLDLLFVTDSSVKLYCS